MNLFFPIGVRNALKIIKSQSGVRGNGIMYLYVEVTFHAGQRKILPQTGYRPDAVFNKSGDYWGITFIELNADRFDVPTPAIIKFSFQDCHCKQVHIGQKFLIMEGSHQVGEGKIISVDLIE